MRTKELRRSLPVVAALALLTGCSSGPTDGTEPEAPGVEQLDAPTDQQRQVYSDTYWACVTEIASDPTVTVTDDELVAFCRNEGLRAVGLD